MTIPHPESQAGQELGADKLLKLQARRSEMTAEELAADLTRAEAKALLAFYESVRLCRGQTAWRPFASGLISRPSWADTIETAKHPNKDGREVVKVLKKAAKG